ncbi:hypothetical protein NA57DRAFT_54699 [Rhizodiscina lignyota]|uniref:GPI anchored serine-threonine rich protein n=1 Tax=Rhizodiscina lignyota TaxID=1504668 RepID=A0A9P4IM32_9PEZI|nr:hypothetical protein NA57DRAFT_54699 [Rhizodiscina lignyota]
MRFTTAVVLIASAGFAAAQSDTTDAASATVAVPAATATASVSTVCDAENIVKTCLATTQVQVDNCDQTDYECLCAAYNAQLTCYNNCPNDAGRSTPQSFVTSYCQAASAQSSLTATKSTSTKKSSSTASSESSESSAASTTSSSPSTSDTSSASAGSASASSTGVANNVVVPAAGSMLAIVLGVFGML